MGKSLSFLRENTRRGSEASLYTQEDRDEGESGNESRKHLHSQNTASTTSPAITRIKKNEGSRQGSPFKCSPRRGRDSPAMHATSGLNKSEVPVLRFLNPSFFPEHLPDEMLTSEENIHCHLLNSYTSDRDSPSHRLSLSDVIVNSCVISSSKDFSGNVAKRDDTKRDHCPPPQNGSDRLNEAVVSKLEDFVPNMDSEIDHVSAKLDQLHFESNPIFCDAPSLNWDHDDG